MAPPTPIRPPQSKSVNQIDDDEDDEDKPFITRTMIQTLQCGENGLITDCAEIQYEP
ncbi:hypothetical protein H6F74_27805 [Trichocoleus sp. FACHB-90]|uniref:hypothetical protein n=1 Tax=Funiculus sociatus TaxID=450527 RepID=UPI0016869826|nr:hypothetical protein [Trichocoleus sp. FACHB-90]